MESTNLSVSHPTPDTTHDTFDWRVAPLLLQDAHCTNPRCGTYQQADLSRLQFQTRPSYPVQVRCQECHHTWNSVNVFFRQIHSTTSEAFGFIVTLGTLGALPYMPWESSIRYGAMGAVLLAQLQLVGKLYQRAKRKRAYHLFADLTHTAQLIDKPLNIDELKQQLSKLPNRFDNDLRQSILAFVKGLQERGLDQLKLLQQAALIHRQGKARSIQRQVNKATLEPKERESIEELLQLLDQMQKEPDTWTEYPQRLQDILNSLLQDLTDWPQSSSDEAQEIFANIQSLQREGQEILDRMDRGV